MALNSLRSSATEQNDLAEALRRAGEECRMQRAMEFDLLVEGKTGVCIRSCATRSIELRTKRFATLAHTPDAIA